ncbi:MAG: GTPase ObgE [Candidatus Moranbacteria bacterium]|nr:GTPase ObgE [Candidatus Moranbacteria bacterium]
MIIDDVKINVKAGKGGNGMVAFAKTMMNQGPTGGNGGKGGNIILKGVVDLGALKQFRTKKGVKAENGKDGAQNTRTGADGKAAVVLVPVGTIAHDLTRNKKHDITEIGQEIVVAEGGNGGFGNFHFRSSRNTTPTRANPGKEGKQIDLRLELKMIADIGFVGYPNVGKSSLLNELTNASSRVANYKFTTLEPHLGVYYELILADIPGLIEGAAEGKGLGHKFLKHVERTRVLFHFIAADSEDPLLDYQKIREELGKFNPELLEKPEYIIVSKTDEKSPEEVLKIMKKLKKENKNVFSLSLLDEKSVENVKKLLNEIKDKK